MLGEVEYLTVKLLRNLGLIDLLEKGNIIMADRGFDIEESCGKQRNFSEYPISTGPRETDASTGC